MFNVNVFSSISEKMGKERPTLADVLNVKFKNAEFEEGYDVRVYNHMLNKGEVAKLFNMSNKTLTKRLDAFNEAHPDNPIYPYRPGPIVQRFTLHDVDRLREFFDAPRYSEKFHSTTCLVTNHKGGVGKSTTTVTLAVKLALDKERYPRVCLIDIDPQGTCGSSITMAEKQNDKTFLTMIDIILRDYEDNLASQLMKKGVSLEQIVTSACFSSHLPNLKTFVSFPTDDRFTDIFWSLSSEDRIKLIQDFKNNILPILKQHFDIILIDSPPQDQPILWFAYEATDMVLVPITPRQYDYISTENYLDNIAKRCKNLPSSGNNIKWGKLAIVNYNSDAKHEVAISDQIRRAAGEHILTADLVHSPAFLEASETGRTISDLKKVQLKNTSDKQLDAATLSVNAFTSQFVIELHKVSQK